MSKNYGVVIIDDEAPARDVIKDYLKAHDNFQVVTECSNGFEGIKAIQENKPDLVFLDIQMPKLTGFEMLELMDDPPVIVFSTAYDQYAIKAFEVNAADYLLKPFSRERFAEAIDKALVKLKDRTGHANIVRNLISHHDADIAYLERIVTKSGSQIFVIPIEKLLWLEAQDDYVMLHTVDDEFLKQKTMKYFESHLNPERFIRIHRSYIVRIDVIDRLELFGKDSYKVRLRNGTLLPVSRNGHQRLKAVLS